MKIQIKYWEKMDKMFVTTRGSEYIMKSLKDTSCLTLTAPSGLGKSFIARHTALVLQKEGYTIIPVIKPDDIRNYYQPGKQTVFIVDDICGNFTANQQQIENWQQLLPIINTVIADKCCKIIVSCRLQVYKDDRFNILVPFKSCECNLISPKLCLTTVEKNNMANKYIGSSLDNIDELSQNNDFFPLLCSLYHKGGNGDVNAFFKNPFIVYQNELDNLRRNGDEGNYKICSLGLLVLFNNELKETWFQGSVKNEQKHILEDTCEACKLNRGTSKQVIKESLQTLDGTFVYKQNGVYKTVHDKLFDFLAYYFGQKMVECLIDHGDSDLVHERFILRKSPYDKNSNIDFIIEIPDDYLEAYLKRLIKDWTAGKVRTIFLNNNMKVELFRQQLLQYLEKLDKPQQVTLVNTKDTVLPKEHTGSGCIPLIGACYNGYTDMIQWMLHNDVNVDQCRDDGVTGLHMACQEGHTDIVKLLLESNPNINVCTNKGSSPLYKASQYGHTDIVKLLIERSPDVNVGLCQNDRRSSLFIASQNGHTDIVELLLKRNHNVDLCGNNGGSPLYKASQNGHTNIVKLLLKRNPDIDKCSNNGCSPLYKASQNGHTDIVKLLLERNANIELCDKKGCSPLHMASQQGHIDIVRLLLEMNADIDLRDKNGCSSLYMACQEGHIDIVSSLLERNANISLCNDNGLTPIAIANHQKHTDILLMLFRKK